MLRFLFPAAKRYCDPAMIACNRYSSFGVLGRFQDQGEERQVKGEEKQRNIDYAREAATTASYCGFFCHLWARVLGWAVTSRSDHEQGSSHPCGNFSDTSS